MLIGVVQALSACGLRSVAAIQSRSALLQPAASVHEVQRGDTLYSIAWESGHDYRDIAEWNGLDPPYLIKPGRTIRLYPPRPRPPPTADGYRTVVKGDTLFGIANDAGLNYRDVAAWNHLKPPYVITPGQRLRLAPPPGFRNAARPTTRSVRAETAPHTQNYDHATGKLAWRWPSVGKVIAQFAPSDGTKGIDIAGTAGQPVVAAAPGKVVYRGGGLRGYGQLIIIKHNVDFLSAYAHCAAIYVREGSVIKTGEKIAAMGSTGTDRVKLHFEIRRRGVPVDPLNYLPKQ